MEKSLSIKYFGYVFLFVGITMFFISLKETIEIYEITSQNNIIQCEIIGERFSQFSKEDVYVYTVQYKVDGKIYLINTENNSNFQKYFKGQKLTLFYDISNPTNAVVNNWDEIYGGQIISYFLALVFVLFSLIFIKFHKGFLKIFKPE